MGRRKKVTVIEEPITPEEEILTKQDERRLEKEEQKALEMEEWLSIFQRQFTDQPARIRIDKFEEGGWSVCRTYPLVSYDPESVREEFGGGKYRATLQGADGLFVEGGRNHFKFAEPIRKPQSANTNPLDNPMVMLIIESMKGQQNQMLELTKSMIAANAAAPKQGNDLAGVIAAMKGLHDLTPKEKPFDNFKETLGMMKLVKEVTGDGEEKGGLLSEIRQFLEIYPDLKDKLATIKPVAAPALPPRPPAPEPERKTPVLDPLSQKIVSLIPLFVAAAKKSEPIDKWGEILLDKTDTEIVPLLLPSLQAQYGALVKNEDDVYNIILRLAGEPTEREKIFRDIPPLAPYRVWVNAVIDEAVRLAEIDPEEAKGENAILEAVGAKNGKTPPAGVEG